MYAIGLGGLNGVTNVHITALAPTLSCRKNIHPRLNSRTRFVNRFFAVHSIPMQIVPTIVYTHTTQVKRPLTLAHTTYSMFPRIRTHTQRKIQLLRHTRRLLFITYGRAEAVYTSYVFQELSDELDARLLKTSYPAI